MQSTAVVEHRNVFGDIPVRFFPGLIADPMDPFGFERAKEALGHSVNSRTFTHRQTKGLK